jgi:transposase
MQSSPETTHSDALSVAQAQIVQLQAVIESLTHQLNWFRQQLFGTKSEKRHLAPDAQQLSLGDAFKSTPQPEVPSSEVKAHQRKRAARPGDEAAQPFFDESRVPIETIVLPCPLTAGLSQAEIDQRFESIGMKLTYRLAQRPGSFVVLKYERAQYKERESGVIACAPAPLGVLEGSRADVSFIAAMVIDKIAYHLPLYRQHQRLIDAGFKVSRQWLTQLLQQAAELLTPIYEAQFDSVRMSRIKSMDETPIRAGLAGPGKMKTGYFWPVYGEHDEICFAFHPSHHHDRVAETLGLNNPPGAVLVSDGNDAYAKYAARAHIQHARCWTHLRRHFFEAKGAEPQAAEAAMQMIAALYKVEERIREKKLVEEPKQMYRAEHSKPIVDAFFAWVDEQFANQGLFPSNPLTQALAYARDGRAAFEVFLTDADVPIDTNHLERALRVIPMGKKNWLFAWTELGAKHIGVFNSLIVTCRLQGVNPYDYLVDVLQRISVQPNHLVSQLTPRLWKQHFAGNLMRSDLYQLGKH